MMMTRTDFARWLLFAVICWTFVAAYAGNLIFVIMGALYVLIASVATVVDVMENRGGKEET